MQGFNDPIDGTNAGPSGGSASGSTGSGTGGVGSGATGGSTGGLGGSSEGLGGGTTGGSTGGYGGSTGGSGLGGGTTGGDAGGYGGAAGGTGGLGDSSGGYGGSTGGTGGTGGVGGGTTGGDAGGYGGSTGAVVGGTTSGDVGGYGGAAGGTGGLGDSSGGYGGSTGGTGETGGVGDDFDLHEPTYRRHYTTVGTETPGTTGTYDEARTGYAAGHAAASNPAYADRSYDEVEVDLERNVGTERFGRVREFARHAYEWKRVVAGVALVAAGGYWASKKLFNAAAELSEEEERDCRTYYETHTVRSSGVPYTQARNVYVLGYVAGRNPEYAGRGYQDVEPHLRGGFTGRGAGSYDQLADFGRRGYERGSTRGSV